MDGLLRDARTHERKHVFLSATLNSQAVRLRDLSQAGCLCEGISVPIAGAETLLERGAMRIAARVVWAKDGSCGLRFADLVDPAAILKAEDAAWAEQRRYGFVRRPN